MKKTLILLTVALSTFSFGQKFAGMYIGESKCKIESTYGKPDKIEYHSWKDKTAWKYKYHNVDLYAIFPKCNDKLEHIVVVGDNDNRKIFTTRLGSKLGDTYANVKSKYGCGTFMGDCEGAFSVNYGNITFTFDSNILNMIDVHKKEK